jgi:hypothetical protein
MQEPEVAEMDQVLRAKRPRRSHLPVAAAALAVALACALAPRAATACSCIRPRPQLLATTPDGTFPAALALRLASPPDAFFEVQDANGRTIPNRRLVQLPRLGLCEMPWFLIALDDDPVAAGEYRLARAPGDADTFVVTAGAFTTVGADLEVSLTVETHDPITPADSLCADLKISGRPFTRTAHLSFALSARDEAAPLYVTATVPDPATPGGLAQSSLIRPLATTGPDIIELPLEDGAEPCADVMAYDAAGRIAVIDRLCAPEKPETHKLRTWTVVPVVEPAGLERGGWGCAVAGGGRHPIAALAILAALGIIVCTWRPRPRNPSTRTG